MIDCKLESIKNIDDRLQKITDYIQKSEQIMENLSKQCLENTEKINLILEKTKNEEKLIEEINEISKNQKQIQEQMILFNKPSKKLHRIESMIQKIEEIEITENIDEDLWLNDFKFSN